MANSSEIFSALLARQRRALLFHDQWCVIFNFLNLHGFKRLHQYRYLTESKEMLKIQRYYIKQHDRLIKPITVEAVSEIPNDWYGAERSEVTANIIAQHTKRVFQSHIQWESDTLALLRKSARELMEQGEVADYEFVSDMICDVSKELEYAKRLYYKIGASGFDVIFLEEIQDEIHDKFKEKMK